MLKKMRGFIHAPKNGAGFTLIEVLLVVIILGLLAAIILPRFTTSAATTKSKACKTNIHDINVAWEEQYAEDGTWTSLTELLNDTSRFPDGVPTCPWATAYADTNPANNRADYSMTHDQHTGW